MYRYTVSPQYLVCNILVITFIRVSYRRRTSLHVRKVGNSYYKYSSPRGEDQMSIPSARYRDTYFINVSGKLWCYGSQVA